MVPEQGGAWVAERGWWMRGTIAGTMRVMRTTITTTTSSRCARWLLALSVAAAGGGGAPPPGASVEDARVPSVDAGRTPESGVPVDGGSRDAGALDAALPAGWRADDPVPERIQEIAAAVHRGVFYIAGGFNGSLGVVRTVRTFDPATGAWGTAPDLPRPRHHIMLVSSGPDLYAIGGMETTRFEVLDTAWVLRDGASAWEPIASPPEGRAAAVGAFIGGRVIIVAGQHDRGLAPDALIYDPSMDRWTRGAPLTRMREHVSGFVHEGEVWVVAGRELSLSTNSTAVDIYDPAMNAWREGPSIPTARGGHGVAVLDGRAYAIGGEQPDRALDSVEVLDLSAGTWSASTPVPTPRHGHVVLAGAGRVWVIGGANRPIFAAVDAVESYAP